MQKLLAQDRKPPPETAETREADRARVENQLIRTKTGRTEVRLTRSAIDHQNHTAHERLIASAIAVYSYEYRFPHLTTPKRGARNATQRACRTATPAQCRETPALTGAETRPNQGIAPPGESRLRNPPTDA